MALLKNGYRLGFSPFARRIGALVSIYNGGGDIHTGMSAPGRLKGSLFGEYAGRPIGNLHPASWSLPQKAGAMSMRATGSGGLTANLYPTRAMAIDLTGSGSLAATGALIISMFASLTGSGSLTANIQGLLNMSASIGGSGSLSADMEGIASMACDLLGAGDLDATIAAFGNMEIDIVVTGAGLSTANVGQAVWTSVLANYAEAGNAAQALSTASSGGVDYNALAAAVWQELLEAGFTAADMVRIMSAALAGERSGIGTATESYKGLDGSTVRVSLTPDAAGNGAPVVDGTV